MANKEALRELQARLADRLQAARTQERRQSWLAVECAGRGMLLPLSQAGEIFALSPLMPVPHAKRWFLGVANLRGGLHGVVDLAAFFGLDGAQGPRDQARLVALNPALEVNCALLVDRLAGLRSAEQLQAQQADAEPRPAFVGARFRDEAGRLWQELNLSALAADDSFLKVAG